MLLSKRSDLTELIIIIIWDTSCYVAQASLELAIYIAQGGHGLTSLLPQPPKDSIVLAMAKNQIGLYLTEGAVTNIKLWIAKSK